MIKTNIKRVKTPETLPMSLPMSPHSIITEADTCIPTSEVPLYPSQFLSMVPANQASSILTT